MVAGRPAAEVPDPWQSSADRIAAAGLRKVLVLGGTDCGKSTYCGFLARRLVHAGFRVALVDADIGQKDIGPPATVSLAEVGAGGDFSQAVLRETYFVGSLSPARHLLPLVVGTRRLVDVAPGDFVIIDTTGLVHGLGRVLKTFQIELLQPDVIVAIEKAAELEGIVRQHRHREVWRLKASARAVSKSPAQRRSLREAAFRDHFAQARRLVLSLDGLVVQGTALFTGQPFSDPSYLYCERTSEGVVAVCRPSGRVRHHGLTVIPAGFDRDLLCGVADEGGRGRGLAIIEGIDFAQRRVTLHTPVPPAQIRVLQIGDIHLGLDGRERGPYGAGRC